MEPQRVLLQGKFELEPELKENSFPQPKVRYFLTDFVHTQVDQEVDINRKSIIQ